MVPWILYVFFAQGNIVLGIGLSVLYGVIVIARQIMEPKVLASSVGLDPLATLIAMFVGLKLFGLLGLIVGPVSSSSSPPSIERESFMISRHTYTKARHLLNRRMTEPFGLITNLSAMDDVHVAFSDLFANDGQQQHLENRPCIRKDEQETRKYLL